MSKRREAGEVVRKQAGAGFSSGECLIGLEAEDDREPCVMGCGDPACCGWSNCLVISRGGKPTGHYVGHVYECQMADV